MAGLAVDTIAIAHDEPKMRWSEPILFDRAVRDALVIKDDSTRGAIGHVSWGIFATALVYPIVVDVPVAFARGGRHLAWQFFWQDLLVLTTTGAIDLGIRELAGRVRPDSYTCSKNGGADCLTDRDSTQSFPNGHFAMGTASAALTCVQHLETGLYGGPWDGVTCATAITANLAMGAMRIMADRHWATDTIVGGVLGLVTGGLLPELLWYRRRGGAIFDDATAKRAAPAVIPMPLLLNGGLGVSLTGFL